jgi:hypothetical protein
VGPRRPTTARQPVLGLPASLLLHGLAVASMFLVFNSAYQPPEESHVVPVDLVTVAQETNIAAAAPKEEEEPVKRDLEPLPPPEPQMVEAEPAPDVKPPKIEIEAPPKPKLDTRQDISRLLEQLTAPPKPARREAETASQSTGLSTAMSASLADMLRSQIRPCWHPIIGAPNPEEQVVRFDLVLNRDGTVASFEWLNVNYSPYAKAAADAASRAVMECQYQGGRQGYRMPANAWPQWRQFRPMTFDPRQMQQ